MNNDWFEFLKQDYTQGFPAYCGIVVDRVDLGTFETHVPMRRELTQQDGFAHAGIIATMADHTAGYAAFTTISKNQRILTVEFKINYFKPAVGDILICRSHVINTGRKIIVSQSDLFSVVGEQEKNVARATVTLMAVNTDTLNKTAIPKQ
jgi:uncharacterized protein (TIGR00369 family)